MRNQMWKQESPRDQIVGVFSGLQGQISILKTGEPLQQHQLENMEMLCEHIHDLIKWLPQESWEQAKKNLKLRNGFPG